MICPKCKADIPDDSWFCDQCGSELMFCPNCQTPAKGKRCTRCGAVLVGAAQLSKAAPSPPPVTGTASTGQKPAPDPSGASAQPNAAAGGGMTMEDVFNQFGGMFGGTAPDPKPAGAAQPSASSTARPQSSGSSTMRPGANAGPRIADTEPTRLVMADNPAKVVVLKPNAVIGRTTGDYLDVFADQPYVSGTHAQIILHSSMRWLICDKGSTNGTQINGTPLEPHKNYLLKKGQTIEIGFVKFRVE